MTSSPLPRLYMRIRTVLCNTPVHHVVSTLNILNTQQACPTTGNLCTYGAIFAYSSRSVYSNIRAIKSEREAEERERITPSKVLKSDTLKNHRDHNSLYGFHLSLSLSLSSPLSLSLTICIFPLSTEHRSFLFVSLPHRRATVETTSRSTF